MECRGWLSAAAARAIAVVVAIAGCGGGGGGTGPTAPLVPVAGTAIAIESIAPASGSTLAIGACPDLEPQGLCTGDLRATFSVLPERDLARARIFVAFYEGDLRGRQCATATSDAVDLAAGRRVSLTVSRVDLILRRDGAAPAVACELPATTQLLIATLVQDPDQQSHSEDFDLVYTFARP
jgi:hypothetical protein